MGTSVWMKTYCASLSTSCSTVYTNAHALRNVSLRVGEHRLDRDERVKCRALNEHEDEILVRFRDKYWIMGGV